MSDYVRGLRQKIGNDFLMIPSVTVATFDDQDRVLLVRHVEGNLWVTPGGMVEPDEVPADAAVREVWEETGVHVELLRILGVYGGPDYRLTYRNGHQVAYVVTVFKARLIAGVARPDGRETLEVGFFSREEVKKLRTGRWISFSVDQAFGDQLEAGFVPPTWEPPATP